MTTFKMTFHHAYVHKNSSNLALYFSKIWRLVGGITADTEVALQHLICAV